MSRILTLNTLTLEKNDHVVVQRPQCPRCGNPEAVAERQAKPLVLQPRKKAFLTDGGHRICSPAETLEKLEHHISPLTGIVRGLHQNAPERENGLVVSYVAERDFVHLHDSLSSLRQSLRGMSGGKGRWPTQAKTSALCEAIEHHSGVFQGYEARFRARLIDLGPAGLHPNACMLFSQRQYAHRAPETGPYSVVNWVPEPFDEKQEIEWSPAWSLTHEEPRYLPTAYVYYEYASEHGLHFTHADSNGCAAGNCYEEAILQGFMELVERDSVALWWYNRLKKPGVNLDSFGDPYFHQLQDYYRKIGREYWVLDITNDLTIPAFVAISRRTDQPREDIIFGFGAHFDPKLALLRAVTELNQMLPTTMYADTPHGNINLPHLRDAIDWWNTATLEDQPYLVQDETASPKVLSDYPRLWSDDLYTDVMNCAAIVREKGLDMMVLDQTRPDVGLNVVKVLVPGLRHFWARFAPGRLYDVPVQMGWLEEPHEETDLNRPTFF